MLLACQWALGAAMQGRISLWVALAIEAGALATATSVLDMLHWHWLFKPLAMVFALIAVMQMWRGSAAFSALAKPARGACWLAAALAASMAGDVFLMLPDLFIPGLASFLLAHLAYIVLLRQDAPWFAHRPSLAATLALGAGMYAVLWQGGLPAALRLPVAAYVLVIALMAAQAWAARGIWAARRPGRWPWVPASSWPATRCWPSTDLCSPSTARKPAC